MHLQALKAYLSRSLGSSNHPHCLWALDFISTQEPMDLCCSLLSSPVSAHLLQPILTQLPRLTLEMIHHFALVVAVIRNGYWLSGAAFLLQIPQVTALGSPLVLSCGTATLLLLPNNVTSLCDLNVNLQGQMPVSSGIYMSLLSSRSDFRKMKR